MQYKILIVDDDANICELLRLYLEKNGFDTVVANDGEQAVEEGLIDELGGLAQAVGKLTELIEARIPAQKKGE